MSSFTNRKVRKVKIKVGDIRTLEVKRVGRGKVKVQHLFFKVEIIGIQLFFGREMYLVKPVSGTGTMLVEKLIK